MGVLLQTSGEFKENDTEKLKQELKYLFSRQNTNILEL